MLTNVWLNKKTLEEVMRRKDEDESVAHAAGRLLREYITITNHQDAAPETNLHDVKNGVYITTAQIGDDLFED